MFILVHHAYSYFDVLATDLLSDFIFTAGNRSKAAGLLGTHQGTKFHDQQVWGDLCALSQTLHQSRVLQGPGDTGHRFSKRIENCAKVLGPLNNYLLNKSFQKTNQTKKHWFNHFLVPKD